MTKLPTNTASALLLWGDSSSPSIMSGVLFCGRGAADGVGAELVGSCGWVDGWGRPLCAVERGRPTTQTDMLTANTNMAKQMVHAYLFRFPFKCTPQLCESALSCIEGRTYQLPSSLLTLKRPFHSGTMRGLLLSLGPQPLHRTMFNLNGHRSMRNNTPEVIGLIRIS